MRVTGRLRLTRIGPDRLRPLGFRASSAAAEPISRDPISRDPISRDPIPTWQRAGSLDDPRGARLSRVGERSRPGKAAKPAPSPPPRPAASGTARGPAPRVCPSQATRMSLSQTRPHLDSDALSATAAFRQRIVPAAAARRDRKPFRVVIPSCDSHWPEPHGSRDRGYFSVRARARVAARVRASPAVAAGARHLDLERAGAGAVEADALLAQVHAIRVARQQRRCRLPPSRLSFLAISHVGGRPFDDRLISGIAFARRADHIVLVEHFLGDTLILPCPERNSLQGVGRGPAWFWACLGSK